MLNSYDALFRAYACSGGGLGDESFETFGRLMSDKPNGYRPTPFTYVHLLNAFGTDGDVSGARSVWNDMLERSVSPNVHSANAMIRVYMTAERFDDALRFYKRMFVPLADGSGAGKDSPQLTEVDVQRIGREVDDDSLEQLAGAPSPSVVLVPNESTRAMVLSVCERGASEAARDARILAVAAPIGYVAGGVLGRVTGLW